LQLAALFHDVERLESETERRVEQLAPHYQRFKARHARRGAELTRRILNDLGLPEAVVERAAELVSGHEQTSGDRERALLNDADGLSFFSLNSWGYLRYFGLEQTRRKVDYTLGRMSSLARCLLDTTRQPAEIHAWLEDAWCESRPGCEQVEHVGA
jgi:predicted transcriptional regulator